MCVPSVAAPGCTRPYRRSRFRFSACTNVGSRLDDALMSSEQLELTSRRLLIGGLVKGGKVT